MVEYERRALTLWRHNAERLKKNAMKLTLDVKSIQYNTKPQSALYDPKKTSSTAGAAKAITWTINGTAPDFCVSAFSGSAQSENDSKPK